MPEVTINRQRSIVMGNRRKWIGNIDIAADVDTLTLSNQFKIIESASFSSPTNNAIGFTVSGGVITLQTGGAEAGVHGEVVGL